MNFDGQTIITPSAYIMYRYYIERSIKKMTLNRNLSENGLVQRTYYGSQSQKNHLKSLCFYTPNRILKLSEINSQKQDSNKKLFSFDGFISPLFRGQTVDKSIQTEDCLSQVNHKQNPVPLGDTNQLYQLQIEALQRQVEQLESKIMLYENNIFEYQGSSTVNESCQIDESQLAKSQVQHVSILDQNQVEPYIVCQQEIVSMEEKKEIQPGLKQMNEKYQKLKDINSQLMKENDCLRELLRVDQTEKFLQSQYQRSPKTNNYKSLENIKIASNPFLI